ncbi:PREDICTED: coiled-coil-helix-coiled-coil-helix domain-containing protein 1 [Poecilia mexicana]|uniref:Coiled-coil-helix-coiled-coil-helix domain containing 1 n=2 Tax=Poecilia TaxID=8080 RepID=A0A087YB93_POEFO|nr:PREDICTED: coiled-coil-helix-coiled-coil-helix domain-containing protein 1 [Poecilia formosa]XP_014846592.1 PREDICTED: coiled-coil-helix-coiled-coil-helix domain-containing protein 1 [Poecilia mexicana]
MAAQGGVLFQEKVSRLLSRENGKPVLKPNRPLILKDSVGNRKPRKGEASCVTEMSLLMACWKQNNFVDSLCSNEINTFYTCVHKAEAARKNMSEQSNVTGGRLTPKQATTLLKRFPNLRSEI